MSKPKWVLTKKKLKKLRKKDDGAFLESYSPLGSPSADPCLEDSHRIGRQYESSEGLYVNVEVGEGPTGWV